MLKIRHGSRAVCYTEGLFDYQYADDLIGLNIYLHLFQDCSKLSATLGIHFARCNSVLEAVFLEVNAEYPLAYWYILIYVLVSEVATKSKESVDGLKYQHAASGQAVILDKLVIDQPARVPTLRSLHGV